MRWFAGVGEVEVACGVEGEGGGEVELAEVARRCHR